MFHLIKLEQQKNKLGWFVKGTIVATIFILVFSCLLPIMERNDGQHGINNTADYLMFIGAFVRGVFIVFAAVLIAKIIIEEFKNRTILVMFSYPINRKKILSAKLILIFCMTFIAMTISNIIVIIAFFGLNQIVHLTSVMNLTPADFLAAIVKLILFNLATAGAALVPLYFGMIKYSTPATIISSLLIVMVTSSSVGPNFSLASIIYIPLGLALIAFGIVASAIRKIDRIDVN